jgi:hypothetical protein
MDTREYLAERAQDAELRRLEAEERRLEAKLKYLTFLNSAAGQEQLAEIANGYMARRKRASLWCLILGVIAISAVLIFVVAIFNESEGIIFKCVMLAGALLGMIWHFFPKLWKKRSELPCSMIEARALASFDISQNFAYEDEAGDSCLPDTEPEQIDEET